MTLMQKLMVVLLAITALAIFIQPVFAETEVQDEVIYQTNFATNPLWTTNSPRMFYWVPEKGIYHYSIEASTGSYAYVDVGDVEGSFTLEYDLTPQSTVDNSAFRFGLTKEEMLRTKGTVALTEFTNGKSGRLMWIRTVTPSNKLFEVSSYAFSYGEKSGASTVNFADNTTYHVMLQYDDDRNVLTMRVYDKATGAQIWGYFLNTNEPLKGMNRLALGPLGDFSNMGPVAEGYIDNVLLTAQKTVTVTPAQTETATTQPTVTRRTVRTTAQATTAAHTPEPTTPVSLPTVLASLCAAGAAAVAGKALKRR